MTAHAQGHGSATPLAPGTGGRPAPDGATMNHAGMGHAGTAMTPSVTGPQLAVVGVLTVLALTASSLFAVSQTNLTLSARDIGGLVMAPGMVMTRETSAQTMRDMAAVDLGKVTYTAPRSARGDQPLAAQVVDGVKVYSLDTAVIRWNILPDVQMTAYAYNQQIPGPRLELTEGDRVRFNVTNRLSESTTVHWHGLIVPNAMDGPGEITQRPIAPGETFAYEFTVQQPGTYFYHSHDHVDRQQALGLYGALIVNPRLALASTPPYDKEVVVQLQEWLYRDGYTFPAMPMDGGQPNYFTINGKAYPETETVQLKVGERLRVRFIGSSSGFIHPMHIHGGPFRIIETDGNPVPTAAQILKDSISVAPGERYDVIWEAREPGKWLLHCHINHHTTNDNREEHGGGGLMMVLNVT